MASRSPRKNPDTGHSAHLVDPDYFWCAVGCRVTSHAHHGPEDRIAHGPTVPRTLSILRRVENPPRPLSAWLGGLMKYTWTNRTLRHLHASAVIGEASWAAQGMRLSLDAFAPRTSPPTPPRAEIAKCIKTIVRDARAAGIDLAQRDMRLMLGTASYWSLVSDDALRAAKATLEFPRPVLDTSPHHPSWVPMLERFYTDVDLTMCACAACRMTITAAPDASAICDAITGTRVDFCFDDLADPNVVVRDHGQFIAATRIARAEQHDPAPETEPEADAHTTDTEDDQTVTVTDSAQTPSNPTDELLAKQLLDSLRATATADFAAEVASLRAQLEASQSELSSTQADLGARTVDLETLRNEIASYEARVVRLDRELEREKSDAVELVGEVDALEAKVRQHEAMASAERTAREQAERAKRHAEELARSYEADLDEALAVAAATEAAMEAKIAEAVATTKTRLERQHETLRAKTAELETARSELDALRADYDRLEQEARNDRTAARTEIAVLTDQLDAARLELDALAVELAEARAKTTGTDTPGALPLRFFEPWQPQGQLRPGDMADLHLAPVRARVLAVAGRIIKVEQPISLARLNKLLHDETGIGRCSTAREATLARIIPSTYAFDEEGFYAEPDFNCEAFRAAKPGEQREPSDICMDELREGFLFLMRACDGSKIANNPAEMISALRHYCGFGKTSSDRRYLAAYQAAQALFQLERASQGRLNLDRTHGTGQISV